MKRIFFRVDMNRTIATGHVMRCLSVADAVRDYGGDVSFICADHEGEDLIRLRGYRVFVLETDWADLDSELPVLLSLLESQKVDTLVIDSYFVTEYYLERLKDRCFTVYIDDINRFLYRIDLLICYAACWKTYRWKERYEEAVRNGSVSEMPQLLLGREYIPLRREFKDCPRKMISEQVNTLLILSGGSDNIRAIARILRTIPVEKFQRVEVVCGEYYPDFDEIDRLYRDTNVNLRRFTPRIKDFMDRADVAISAGGTMLYELGTVGVPTIAYALADNQVSNAEQMADDGLIFYAGDLRKKGVESKIRSLLLGCLDPLTRRNYSHRMRRSLDGRGAERIAEALCAGGE